MTKNPEQDAKPQLEVCRAKTNNQTPTCKHFKVLECD